MNKKFLISLAGAALLSMGLSTATAKAAVISPNPTPTTTDNGSTTGELRPKN
jgi:hypothetical protein